MTTYNTVRIIGPEGAPPIDLDTLPDPRGDWGLWEGDGWDASGDGIPTAYGHSKWSCDEIDGWAKAFTEENPDYRIEHGEEWDDDTPGKSMTVYVKGEISTELSKHDEMVPDNLRELIANVRKHVTRNRYGDVTVEHGKGAMESVMALLDALDPEGACA